MKLGLDTQISMTLRDAESKAAMLESHPEGSRRNRREEGLGASKVTATRVSLFHRWRVSVDGGGRLGCDCHSGALCASWTAVYGTVRTVVWEDGGRWLRLLPDWCVRLWRAAEVMHSEVCVW